MDFAFSKEQLAFRDRVGAFALEHLADDVINRDRDSQFNRELWQRCADFGLLSYAAGSAYSKHDDVEFMTALLAMEALGHSCRDNGLAFAVNAHVWTVQLPILKFGSDAQKQRYLPGMCDGTLIGAHAITEPGTGSDLFSMEASARKVDGGYVLNGHKHYVSLAPIADVALVFALTDPDAGKWGVTAFLVDASSDGLRVGDNREKMGLRTVPFGDWHFDDCFVPEENRLGPEGAGVSLSSSFLEWERCAILASQLGAMQRQLDECIAYARDRRQFGQQIGQFQAVSHRIVDMKLRLETSRLLLYKVAWLKQTGGNAMTEAALLKLHLGEAFMASSLDAIRIHGARGYVSEYGIDRDARDAIGGVIYAGTSDIQRNIVARMLGL
ncbi:MAG: acyl-CoA dehydrogenase family protein [Gammaproteobacteria bacterium]